MAPNRRSGRKSVRKAPSKTADRYVVEATFKLRSPPISKSKSVALAASMKKKGAKVTTKRV